MLLRLRKATPYGLKLIIIGTILYFLYQKDVLNLSSLSVFVEHPVVGIAAVLLVIVISNSMMALRLKILLVAHQIGIPLLKLTNIHWIGLFFSTVLPGSVTGESVKAIYLIRSDKTYSKATILTVIMVDKIMALVALVLLAFAGILTKWDQVGQSASLRYVSIVVIGTVIFMILGALAWALPLSSTKQTLRDKTEPLKLFVLAWRVFDALSTYKKRPGRLALAVGISLFNQLIFIALIIMFSFYLTGESGAWSHFLFAVPLGEISTVIPFAPAGIGVGHAAYEFLFSISGLSSGANVFTAITVVRLTVGILGGIPYLLYRSQQPAPTV
ncbi:MAG: hypothetical protein A2527_02100 [Candidatus Lambdaproteobacteria bacterium RIFOXYD2_FULL_50_16]|uniref:TIGR00374 family protein n=1 Tax=Candidatus Lambdaproteobacteria bacterium RIFOXYD2_FULL_50_16 TaxID=1817772 RepID=A0A1F6GE47_9PROT|nr:MAG: hypothetical protein A2527_02100 [Candidatus Lambdaproteobacteria bacterium RIFOXYD2_FULL_50_16]